MSRSPRSPQPERRNNCFSSGTRFVMIAMSSIKYPARPSSVAAWGAPLRRSTDAVASRSAAGEPKRIAGHRRRRAVHSGHRADAASTATVTVAPPRNGTGRSNARGGSSSCRPATQTAGATSAAETTSVRRVGTAHSMSLRRIPMSVDPDRLAPVPRVTPADAGTDADTAAEPAVESTAARLRRQPRERGEVLG